MLGKLGDLKFEASQDVIRTFSQLSYKREKKIYAHEILGGTYALEDLGEKQQAIEFEVIVAIARGLNAEKELSKIQAMFQNGKKYALTVGKTFFGYYLIEKFSYEATQIDNKGSILAAKINLGLLRGG